jgi:fluoride ion exporter CrcB/FEX
LGIHIAELILPHIPLDLPKVRAKVRAVLFTLSAAAYILAIVFYFVLSKHYRHQATAALLFSVPGALLRHVVSIKLNPRHRSFPLGTFAVNIFATILIGACYSLQRWRVHGDSAETLEEHKYGIVGPLGCVMLQALEDGFCGCLSTVSTFAVEIRGLRRMAWRYVAVSLGMGQLVLVLVVGVPWWSGAVEEGRMCTFE